MMWVEFDGDIVYPMFVQFKPGAKPAKWDVT